MLCYVFNFVYYVVHCFILKSGGEECGDVGRHARAARAAWAAASQLTEPRGGVGHVTPCAGE